VNYADGYIEPNVSPWIAVPVLIIGAVAGWFLRYLLTGRRR
jgi:hypothetical protein